jgi:hypothetical protein
LGFTHYCGWTRYGAFIVKRKTQRTRFIRKLKRLRDIVKCWGSESDQATFFRPS